VSIEQVVERASALGVAGVDVLHRQMDIPEKEPLTADHRAYLSRLKRHALRHGVSYCCLSIHQDFVDPDPAFLTRQVDHTLKCLEIAASLGAGVLRINSGRWNTIPDFDDLMKGVDEVITKGYIDTENLNVYGCSGGGVLTAWIVGHTNRFAAASANCPVTDWISFVGNVKTPTMLMRA